MKRLKKFLKWTAIVLLSVISVVILTVAFLNWRASRKVEARQAPLREAGKPISIADLKPVPVADDQNAAKAVERYSEQLHDFGRQLAEATRDSETDAEYDAGAILAAKNIAQEFPDLNDALRAASRLPAYQPGLDYSLGPSSFMQQFFDLETSPRSVARALYGNGMMLLAAGETDQAIEDAIAMINWSHHIGQQPCVVNQMIATAYYGQGIKLAAKCLYAGDASAEARALLLDACSDESKMLRNHVASLDSERAFGISSFESFPGSRFMHMLGELAAYLDIMQEFQSISEQPTGIAPDQPTVSGMFFATSIWSPLQQGLITLRRNQALMRAVQILAAWQDAGGDIETGLADLGLPATVTTDPFDGSQLKLKVVGNTIAIYSVGKDMVDDSGSIEDERDIGVEP